MAFFVANIGGRLKDLIKHISLYKKEKYSFLTDRIATINAKQCLPFFIAAMVFLTGGLIWVGQSVTATDKYSGPKKKPGYITQTSGEEEASLHTLTGSSQIKRSDGSQVSRGRINRTDINLMARVIEGEAADEPLKGKVAVGAVIINRTESGDFPKEIKGVIYQDLAFEAVANGQYMRPLTKESLKAAELAVNGQDPTRGALYYWNPATASSKWVWQKPITMQIGRHVFAH